MTFDGTMILENVFDGVIDISNQFCGSMSVVEVVKEEDHEIYEGPYSLTPKIDEQEFNTNNKLMVQNLYVNAIPYYEVENLSGGYTVSIATLLEG